MGAGRRKAAREMDPSKAHSRGCGRLQASSKSRKSTQGHKRRDGMSSELWIGVAACLLLAALYVDWRQKWGWWYDDKRPKD